MTPTAERPLPDRLAPREILLERRAADAAPEATVCITLYDYEKTILSALDSVHDQTLERLGLVVLDDRSRDRGLDRVERWMMARGARFASLCLARHTRNQGLAGARNTAIDLSASEFVMVLDADNQLAPRCVERMLESLSGSPYGFAYSIIEQFGERSGLIGCASWNPDLLKRENYIDAMALIRKAAWREVGGYTRMKVGGWEDYDFWCKFVEAGIDGVLVPEILARYRIHGESMLRSTTNVGRNSARVRAEMRRRHPWLES